MPPSLAKLLSWQAADVAIRALLGVLQESEMAVVEDVNRDECIGNLHVECAPLPSYVQYYALSIRSDYADDRLRSRSRSTRSVVLFRCELVRIFIGRARVAPSPRYDRFEQIKKEPVTSDILNCGKCQFASQPRSTAEQVLDS